MAKVLRDVRELVAQEDCTVLGVVQDTSHRLLVDVGDSRRRKIGVISLRDLQSKDSGVQLLRQVEISVVVPVDGRADLGPVRTWFQKRREEGVAPGE